MPFRGSDGEVLGAIVVLQDITAHKETNRALQAADRRKDEFLATLAHELRNPLAAIRNAAAILKAMESSNPEARWVPEVIDRQLAQMSRLLEDLLDVSRIAHDKLALRRQRVELSEVVHNAIETCGPQLDAGKHAHQGLASGRPHFPPRRSRCGWSRSSPTSSATPPSTRRRVVTFGSPANVAAMRSRSRVKDDGIGISPEMLPRLFEIFSQGERASSVRRAVSAWGSRWCAASWASRRTRRGEERRDRTGERVHRSSAAHVRERVRVGLPSAAAAETAVAAKCRVLIADDARDSADSLAVILAMKGHETHAAYDGEEAMAAAARLRPDVVILDIRMPKRNGFEACRWIREQPWGKAMVLIALSGWGTEDDRRRTEEAGFDHHLVKPVAPEVLFALIALAPRRSRSVDGRQPGVG